MKIVIRAVSPWLKIIVYLVVIGAYLVARAHSVRFVYQGY